MPLHLHTRRVAVVVALAAAPHAADARRSSVAAQVDPVIAVAAGLCRQADRPGEGLVVAGPRLTSTSTAPRGEHDAIARALIGTARGNPPLTIAMRSPWLVIHDAGAGAFSRFRCGDGNAEPAGRRPQAERPVRIDVSRLGDVAWTTASNGAFLARSSAWREPPAPSAAETRAVTEVFAGGSGTTHVVWSGSQLIGVGPSHVSLLVADDQRQDREARIQRPAPAAAFGYAGLLYVARGRCWDIYGGADLSPAVLQASCDVPDVPTDSYLAAGPDQLQVLSAAGPPVAQPRPSIIVAHMSGNMRDITRSVARLLTGIYRPSGEGGGTGGGLDPHWREWLQAEAWTSAVSRDDSLRAIAKADWGTLREDGEWWTGKGASVSWAPAWNSVKVHGRSLAQLSAELTSDKRFTDDQVRGIIYNNAELRRSLEGELIYRGWLPIGALLDGAPLVAAPELAPRVEATRAPSREALRRPQAFDSLAALGRDAGRVAMLRDEPFLQILNACRIGDVVPAEPRLNAILRSGVAVFGGLEGTLARALGEPSSAKFGAAETREIPCTTPDSPAAGSGQLAVGQPMRLLVASGARVSADKLGSRALLKQSIVVAGNRQYTPASDWQWPVAIDGDVVIGVQPFGRPRAGWADAALRAWLDRAIRTHPVVERLQVPVAKLRVALPAAAVNRDAIGDSGIQILTLETAPAAARAQVRIVPCPAPPTIPERRDQTETQISLATIPAERRVLLRTPVLVAEPAVEAFASTFDRPELGSIWQVPTRTGLMPMKREADPGIRTAEQLQHGTFVAALLGATTQIKGLLSGTELGWVDLQKSPHGVFGDLEVIRGLGAVMNLSQALDPLWWESFRASVAQSPDWHEHVLVVAAAQNVGEQAGDGEPLKTGHKNVLGVGVADANGDPPTDVSYEMSRVDVLAPGAMIPSITHTGEMACGDGTSLAVAYVSAVAALVAERQDAVNAPLVRARLIATANWKSSYRKMVKGGLLNAARALTNIGDDMLELIVDDVAGTTQRYQTILDHRTGRFTVSGVRATSAIAPADRHNHNGDWFKVLRLTRTGTHAGRPAYRLIFIADNGELQIVEDAVLEDPNKPLKFNNCVNLSAPGAPCGNLVPGKIRDFVARYRPGLVIKSFGGSQ